VMKGTVLPRLSGRPEALLGAYEPEVFGRRWDGPYHVKHIILIR
jgi:hypothetical protein